MVDTTAMQASSRNSLGKGAARAERRAGRVPAIVYGADEGPLPISIDPRVLHVEMSKPGFFSQLFDIDLDGKNQRVLCRDVQVHPVTSTPLHADFLRVSAATRIDVDVPVHFINEEESPGLKRGGVLNIVRHTVELNCRADAIPSELILDLTGSDIGDSLHISKITLPAGVEPVISDRDFTIATVAAPTVTVADEEEDAAEAAEAAEAGEAGEAEGAEDTEAGD